MPPPQDGSLQCPSCKTIYGEKTGTQPKGKMEIYSIGQSLPGHPDCGAIQIIYSIPPGIQVSRRTRVRQKWGWIHFGPGQEFHMFGSVGVGRRTARCHQGANTTPLKQTAGQSGRKLVSQNLVLLS